MSDADKETRPSLTVVAGPNGLPSLRLDTGGQVVLMDVAPALAAQLGTALLSASALYSQAAPPPAQGDVIVQSELPVTAWKSGTFDASGMPALVLGLLGGAELVLRLTPVDAAACGAALFNTTEGMKAEPGTPIS
ncbi:hypothetical protein [Methylobacterium nigriterrae]|uniref:hypothetical protein n=1 Tax=Methylobacterium nigriterrae TaxID=3127512 RepID=UPI003013CF98